ncbi:hypothetical protein FS837_008765 [Tulasnella sp. UAMH 9824]|nr:hypothetical protein FS837_008765 [Tulasnella sp. UAMH 9824]
MPTVSGQAKPAHALVNAIRHSQTPWDKGEAIHREKWYLGLSLEPKNPEKDSLWRDIRSSGLGEVLLDIVVQGAEGAPIDIGEVHLQISSLQALYSIVRGIRVSWNEDNPLEVALKKKTTLTSIFHDPRSTGRPDPALLQHAVIIGAVLADNFGFPNKASKFVVSQYGIRKIIDCFKLVLTDPVYRDSARGGILTGMSAVMLYLWSDDRTHRPLVVDNQIHVLMMNRFWEYQTDRPDDDLMELGPSGLSAVSFLCDIVE